MVFETPYMPGLSRFYSDQGLKIRNKITGEISNEIVTDEKLDPDNFEETKFPVDVDTPI